METTTETLVHLRQVAKFYELCLEDVRQRYDLTKLEVSIVSFLANNPGRDTVADVAECWMLSRGNVSRGADNLLQRGLLERLPDRVDRRWVHLKLLPPAQPVVEDIARARERFRAQLFAGFAPEELETFLAIQRRITENVVRATEGRTENGRE